MLGFAARLIGGIFTPLIDQASASTARLLRKFALFLAAAVALLVVLIALTVAFDLWISSLKGPIVGALSVAGLYLAVAIVAVVMALRPDEPKQPALAREAKDAASAAKKGVDSQIDEFAAPLLTILQSLGLRKEQLAVLAGTSVAKQIGPVPLVGLAIVAGFLIGRMGGGLKGLLSSDLLSTLMASDVLSALFGAKADTPTDERPTEAKPDEPARDAA